eukprot:GGOE01002378.1.p1 GENE.GGOE01002378.1~~GGOE01002378.1.p1  ORF type:complete len:696 (-),score=177.32 GGOE01002378.1:28-2079(-)
MVTLTPSWQVAYQLAALFTCLTSGHAAILLATASIHLNLPKLMVLAAFQFSVQSIFSLHFISMCGMRFPVEWGFDLGLTAVSIIIIIVFGTPAITLALYLRRQLEPSVQNEFLPNADANGILFYAKLLRFILARVSYLKVLLAVILLAVGTTGSHHVGMWSIHGMDDGQVACALNFWSILTTGGIGGTVSVVITLAFLLVPDRNAGMLTAIVLTGFIAAFHYCSAAWGMEFNDRAGITTGLVISNEVDMVFLVVQGALSQVIAAIFSRMAVRQNDAAKHQLQVAQALGQFIAEMDLEPAKAMQLEAHDPSELEKVLFHIVANLQVYRPYLPDTLFAGHVQTEEDSRGNDAGPSELPHDQCRRASVETASTRSYTSSRSKRTTDGNLEPPVRRVPSFTAVGPRSPAARGTNISLGLRPSQLTVLRIRLQGLSFGQGKAMNQSAVEEQLISFMVGATVHIKAHGGTIVTCTGGLVVAFWPHISPDAALETAVAIQQHSNQDLIQVVQSSRFLSGNLATEHLRSFNIVGPMDWVGQQLLRVGSGGQHIFITSLEWHRVRFKYRCLPFEEVLVDGSPITVYTVLPPTRPAGSADDNEWMYELEGNLRCTSGDAEKCWQAYQRGEFVEAKALVPCLSDSPLWYRQHLATLAEGALASQARWPTKSLVALGWPPPALASVQDAVCVVEM